MQKLCKYVEMSRPVNVMKTAPIRSAYLSMIIFKSVSNLERPKISNSFETYDMSSPIWAHYLVIWVRPISGPFRPLGAAES